MQYVPNQKPRSQKNALSQRSFLSHDGTPIGYQVIGDEKNPPFLLANGLGGTYEAYTLLTDAFGDKFCFYCWDYRGMYSSGRPVAGYDALSIANHAQDAHSLMQHVSAESMRGLPEEPFFAFGWSMGVQVLLEMHRTSAERFKGIILHNGVSGRPYRSLGGTSRLEKMTPLTLKGLQHIDRKVSQTVTWAVEKPFLIPLMVRLGLVNHNLDRKLFGRMAQHFKELDWHLYLETLRLLGEHDATDCLPKVKSPLLMVASSEDVLTPLSEAAKIVDNVAQGELEIIDGGSHYAAVEFPERLHSFMNEFLARHWPQESWTENGRKK